MFSWPSALLGAAAFGGIFSVLDRRGLLIAKRIRAVLFSFRPGREGDSAKLNSCTGSVSRSVRFPASGVYTFALTAQLTAGDVSVLLLDRQRPLLRLDPASPVAQAELDKKRRYRLRWKFRHTTGACRLRWDSPCAESGCK